MNINPKKYALKRMYETRTCPTLESLYQGGAAIDEHLKTCPSCQERKAQAEFIIKLQSQISIPKIVPPSPPYAGQICQVLCTAEERLAPDGSWHNPPLVLLLPPTKLPQQQIRVAQIHDASELAAQGDVPLTDLFEDYYVETWNTWSVFAEHLTTVGRIDLATLTLVLKELRSTTHMAKDLKLDILQKIFRDQERSNSSFFQGLEEKFAQTKSLTLRLGGKKVIHTDLHLKQLWERAKGCYDATPRRSSSQKSRGHEHFEGWATLTSSNQDDKLIPMQFDLYPKNEKVEVRCSTMLTTAQMAALTDIRAWVGSIDHPALDIETDFDPGKNILNLLLTFNKESFPEHKSHSTPKSTGTFGFLGGLFGAFSGVGAIAGAAAIGVTTQHFRRSPTSFAQKKSIFDSIHDDRDDEEETEESQFPAVIISLKDLPEE